jgi:hypothetical protein
VTLAGTVSRIDGRPALDADLFVNGLTPADEGRSRTVARSSATSDGTFAFDGLAAGRYEIVAVGADGGVARLGPISAEAGERRRGLRLVLGEGAEIVGRVIAWDGSGPIAGAHAYVDLDTRQIDAVTDSAGQFRLKGAPPGQMVELKVDAQGYTGPGGLKVNAAGVTAPVDVGVIHLVRAPDPGLQPPTGRAGITIELTDDNQVRVRSAPDTFPAGRAGIKPGDVVTAIDGKDIRGIGLPGFVQLVFGVPGTVVQFDVRSVERGAQRLSVRRL